MAHELGNVLCHKGHPDWAALFHAREKIVLELQVRRVAKALAACLHCHGGGCPECARDERHE